jgi:UDP-N-acetylmuramoyl-tripeptide--D-alanyl-D-alanine ligase
VTAGWAAAPVALAAIAVADFRWLRVMQREHYIAGSALATARRWARCRPPNQVLAAIAGAAGLAALARWWPVPAAVAAVAAAAGAAVFPAGMPLVGSPQRLVWTPRLARLAACCLLLEALGAGVALGLGAPAALGALAAAVPAVIDGGALLAAPLEALLARRYRTAARATLARVAPRVIAVTGSYGKTSTKNHLRDLLSGVTEVVASPASWNNAAGLARTVNEYVTPATELLVAEMGTYGPGEIRAMCSWVRPEIGIITAIGPMHLERMKTLDNVTRAKAEILEGTRVAVLNVDDERLERLAGQVAARAGGPEVIRCGTRRQPGLDLSLERALDSVTVRYRGEVLGSFEHQPGVHLGNVACALGAALAAGAPAAAVTGRLGQLAVPAHRAARGVSDSGLVVIDDTYNSNPSGARHALELLDAAVAEPHRRAVITPGMVELGPGQDEENRSLAGAVAKAGAVLVVVGWTNRRALVAGARDGEVVTVASRAAARDWVRSHLAAGDGVLWENDLPNHYP